jgi:hypothetical protein
MEANWDLRNTLKRCADKNLLIIFTNLNFAYLFQFNDTKFYKNHAFQLYYSQLDLRVCTIISFNEVQQTETSCLKYNVIFDVGRNEGMFFIS